MAAHPEVDASKATAEREPSASEASWLTDLLQQAGSLVLRMQVTPVLRLVEVVGALGGLSGLAPAELADNPSLLWRLVHPDDRLAYAQALAAEEPRKGMWLTRSPPALCMKSSVARCTAPPLPEEA